MSTQPFQDMSRFWNALRPKQDDELTELVDRISGYIDSPAGIAEEIASHEKAIAEWVDDIRVCSLQITNLAEQIETATGDILITQTELVKLRKKMAAVDRRSDQDRRVADDCKAIFRERRLAQRRMSGVQA